MKKLLLLVLIPFILCGCTKSDIEEITFSSWGSVSEVKILHQIISDFESENPDIKIKFMHIPQNYFQKIHLLFASNTAPDVVFINNLNIPIYEKYLENMDNEINPEEFYAQSLDGLSYGGHLLAVPRDISNLVFYVNCDLVSEITQIQTLEELLRVAQNSTHDGIFGISFEEDIYWALPYIQAFGENILENEEPQGIKFYIDLRDKYKVAPTKSQVGSSTLAQMFLDGKIAMYLSGRWMYPKISEKAQFDWTVIEFPSKYGVPCDTSGWAISKNSKHKESAKKFIRYLSSEKSSEYFTQTGLIIPARIESSKFVKEKIFIDAAKKSVKTPVNREYKNTVNRLNKKLF